MTSSCDVVVIGGGFFGSAIAAYLTQSVECRHVILLEQDDMLLKRASYNNQARVHNGYHYPRSFTTALRSRVNFPTFVRDWWPAIRRDFQKVYAISRVDSRTTTRQFWRFCKQIGAPLERADAGTRRMFDARTIDEVFVAEEYAFDARVLADLAAAEMARCSVEVHLRERVTSIYSAGRAGLEVRALTAEGRHERYRARLVINCTYSGLNQIGDGTIRARVPLKHEITEMGLLSVPPQLAGMGITTMDGPFFSLMPFPDRQAHTLSHVRYTPHQSWKDMPEIDPYARLSGYAGPSRVERMIRDARRYLPEIEDSLVVGSLVEVKTILVQSEADDGRPILFEEIEDHPGLYFVMGGKLDNIYDVFVHLERVLASLTRRPGAVAVVHG